MVLGFTILLEFIGILTFVLGFGFVVEDIVEFVDLWVALPLFAKSVELVLEFNGNFSSVGTLFSSGFFI